MVIFGLVIFQLFLLVNTSFTAWPEMLAWPYFLTQGWLPYKDIAIVHTPILPVVLGLLFSIFGLSVLNIKIITWLLITLTSLGVIFISRSIISQRASYLVLFIYILLQFRFEGNGLWFDLLLTPLALLLYYLFSKRKYLASGLVWGLMLFTKQTSIWFILPLFPWLFPIGKNIIRFAIGALSILAIFISAFLFFGILKDFLNWAFIFGVFILPRSSGQIQFPSLSTIIWQTLPFLPLTFLILTPQKKFLLWIIAGFMGIFPRWELFHFQPGLPFAALGFVFLLRSPFKWAKASAVSAICLLILVSGRFLSREWGIPDRFTEPQTLLASQFIQDHTASSDSLFVLNSWDSIYAFSHRLPATKPWIPTLEWYLNQPGIQAKMVQNLILHPPQYIVFSPYATSGLGAYRPRELDTYIFSHYHKVQQIGSLIILGFGQGKI